MLVWGKGLFPRCWLPAFAATAGAQQKACEIDEGNAGASGACRCSTSDLAQSAGKPDDARENAQGRHQAAERGRHEAEPGWSRLWCYGKALVDVDGPADHAERHDDARRASASRQPDGSVRSLRRHRFRVHDRRSVQPGLRGADRPVAPAEALGRSRQPRHRARQHAGQIRLGGVSRQALAQLYKNAPYGYCVLAKTAAEKNQPKDAISYYKQARRRGEGHSAQADQPPPAAACARQLAADPARAGDRAKTTRCT